MMKGITRCGDEKLCYQGASKFCSHGARGVLDAVVNACGNTGGSETAKDNILILSVTDRAQVIRQVFGLYSNSK